MNATHTADTAGTRPHTTDTPSQRRQSTAGVGTLLRFGLRRERIGLLAWIIGTAALVGFQAWGSQNLYGSPEQLAALRETVGGSPALVALSGPEDLLATVGGEVVFEIFGYAAIVLALMNMFLVGRRTRSDEENGRAELIRSARVGRRAPVVAAVVLAILADVVAGSAVFVTAVATGLPATGSAVFAAALAGVGFAFGGLTALAAQVFENPRSVYGAVTAAIGVAYVLRAAGDVGDGTLSWLSPIGWGQRTLPYVADRWWPLLLPLVAGVILLAAAAVVLEHRDFGAGIFGYRAGRASASPMLGSTLGLAWRLHRGALAAWATGVFVLSAAYGSFAESIAQFMADNPQIADYLPGGADDAVNAYLALTLMIAALLAAAYGVNSALRARREEIAVQVESVIAAGNSRQSWLAGHVGMALLGSAAVLAAGAFGDGLAYGISISEPSQSIRLIGVACVYLPAVWLIIAVAVLAIGWLPRFATILGWTMFGYCAVIVMFADSFRLPEWTRNASPFTHLPQAPLDPVTATGITALLAITGGLLVAGFAGLNRRDLGY